MSPAALQVLEQHGDRFRGRWSLVETAVLYSRRHRRPLAPDFQPNGLRPVFKTELNLLNDPCLRWDELGVTKGRVPATIGSVLQAELLDYAQRARGRSSGPSGEPTVEMSTRLPSAAFRELKIRAFANGSDVFSELNRRLDAGVRRAVQVVGDLRGPVVEVPVHLPREAYDRGHGTARAIGSRVMAIGTQQMLLDLNAEALR